MYESLTKITIVLCWLSLFSFWAIKLFGGNWFEIMVHNANFIKFSNTVQNTWLKYLVSFITISICNYLMVGAIIQKFVFKGKDLILLFSSIISIWIVANFIDIPILKLTFGYSVFTIIGVIKNKGLNKFLGLASVILDFVFSTISMITRNIDVEVLSNYLIAIIGSIDLYIMYGLYYLYSNLIKLKRRDKMAIITGLGWFGKEEAQERGYNSWKRFWHNFGYVVTFKWARKK